MLEAPRYPFPDNFRVSKEVTYFGTLRELKSARSPAGFITLGFVDEKMYNQYYTYWILPNRGRAHFFATEVFDNYQMKRPCITSRPCNEFGVKELSKSFSKCRVN